MNTYRVIVRTARAAHICIIPADSAGEAAEVAASQFRSVPCGITVTPACNSRNRNFHIGSSAAARPMRGTSDQARFYPGQSSGRGILGIHPLAVPDSRIAPEALSVA